MVELVSLHSFFIKRMMAAAEELFDAVKDSVIAYQQEIERLKQENSSLKNTLAYSRNYRLAETSDRTKKNKENQDGSAGAGKLLQGTLGAEFSAVKVQMEVATVMSHEPLSQASTITSLSEVIEGQEHTQCLTHPPEILLKNEDNIGSDTQSSITDQSEPCDNQAGDINLPEVPNAAISDACIEFIVTEPNVPSKQVCKKISKKAPRKSQQTETTTCNVCGKSFRNKKCLRMHRLVHQSERPFGCDSCRWTFKLKSHLKEHMRLHTGDYRYRCPKCGKGFSRSNHVNMHLKNVHSV